MPSSRDPSAVVEELAVLYELSLAVGRSLDIGETCRTFLDTLVARRNLDFASVWIRRELLPGGNQLSPRDREAFGLAYASPAERVASSSMSALHPLPQRCEREPLFVVGSDSPDFDECVMEQRIEGGTYAVFRLGQFGMLKLYAGTGRDPFGAADMGKLQHVINKFAVAVESSLQHHRLTEEQDQRRRLECHLLQGQKLDSLSQFAGGVAHDFNNLLTTILGNAECLRGMGAAEDESVDSIVAAANRAAGLCGQLQAYAGGGRRQEQPHNLNEVVDEMTRRGLRDLPPRVQVVRELHGSLPAVDCDAGQIQEAISFLVANAAEALGARGGAVTLRTMVVNVSEAEVARYPIGDLRRAGSYVCIEVEDQGHGISEVDQSKIFDPFFSTRSSGRGLGLAAALGIVRSHQGAIEVRSELGAGACFRVLLPVSSKRAVPVEDDAPEAVDMSGFSVLVADDEPGVRSVFEQALQALGFEVVVAADGGEALLLMDAREVQFDLVVLDLSMPVKSGAEVFELLVQQGREDRVILTSGFTETESLNRFTSKRPAAFLAKPFRAGDLKRVVRSVLTPARRSGASVRER